jgi:hypothetical protein
VVARSRKKRRQVLLDTLIVAASLLAAAFIVQTGIVHALAASFNELGVWGSFLAGTFFTSMFTTAPAIVVLAELSQSNPLMVVAIFGGFGAALGDYLIFRFVRDRVAEDTAFLLSHSKFTRLPKIFKTRLSRFMVPLVGALIIASPLPDELGLALLGMSKMNDRRFLLLSFLLNAGGILIIGLVANSLA